MNHGKQLRLFLPDGTASGPRYYELVNWTGQALRIPVSRIKYHDVEEHYTDATKTWNGTYWPCGWHNIIRNFMYGGEAIASMFDQKHFDEQVEITKQDVQTFVARFREIYLEEVTHLKGAQN